jgi:hypothetical protein
VIKEVGERTADTNIPENVVGHELVNGFELASLGGLVLVEFVQAPEPGELEELLGEEEGANKVWLVGAEWG